jgi:PKHD-type hydroxylase
VYSDFLEDSLGESCLDCFYYFDKGFNDAEIDKIRGYADEGLIKTKDGTTFSGTDHELRKSEVGWVPHNQQFHWMYQRLGVLVSEANNEMWNFNLAGMGEEIQYAVYPPDGGHYSWHMDTGPGKFSRRKISITVQLCHEDEYEGGDLQLKIGNGEKETPKGKGTTVIFPSYLLHRVSPLTSGYRKSLVLWVTGPPFK